MITADDLVGVSYFEDFEESDLTWLAEQFDDVTYEDGEEVFPYGASADDMTVILSGELRIMRFVEGSWRFFSEVGPGHITGMLPYSRMKVYEAKGNAVGTLRVGMLNKSRFPDVLYRMPVLGQRLVALMSDRVRSATMADQEHNKLLALGKLSAGLAHELNNPAAAARRAAMDLVSILKELPNTVARLVKHGLTPESVIPAAQVCTLHLDQPALTTLEMADQEDAILDWLEDHDIEEAWNLAPALAESGVTVERLASATANLPAEAIKDVVGWIQQSTTASRLIGEVHAASGRISELVKSVKSYSHMDRSSDKQPVQLQAGIESTVTMLGHKMKAKAISVEKDFPADLPVVSGFPGELNQVWTNIIDNAIDILPDEGRIKIVAQAIGDRVDVCIEDNGPGIPDHVLPHIFEPFYSTKDVGEGTGLGLDIAHRIVVQQHRGQILVESQPGRTRFRVLLPIQ
jgi:signal transduction histidine kinase